MGGTREGEAITLSLEDGSLEVLGHGTVHGIVEVQGRSGPDWDGAQVTVSGGPGGSYSMPVTSADGTWSMSGIVPGTYQVSVEMSLYLDGLKTGQSVTGGGSLDVGQVKVLGGDCNDSDGSSPGPPYGIDINDATIVGNAFGSVPGDGNWNSQGDINDSGNVNILDAVLLGGNWHKSSPVPW